MIWNPFIKKQDYRLGIDIGTSSIRVVELLHSGREIRLSNYAQFYAGDERNAIHSSSLKILDSQVEATLKEMFAKASFIGRKASMAIPVFSSFSTLINLPAMADEELDKAVRYEARKYIPVPITEVQFDWMKVPYLSNNKKFKILTISVPNEIIEKYYRIAKALNISVANIELETFSAARALLKSDNPPVIILDIGSRSTSMSIVEQGLAIRHHNVDASGFHLTLLLSRGLSIDLKRAEEMKKREGLRDGQVAKLLYPLIDKIILEMEKMIEDYLQQGGSAPSAIIIIGGSAAMLGLAEYIQKSLNIKTAQGNAFYGISVPAALKGRLEAESLEFAVAAGLALR